MLKLKFNTAVKTIEKIVIKKNTIPVDISF